MVSMGNDSSATSLIEEKNAHLIEEVPVLQLPSQEFIIDDNFDIDEFIKMRVPEISETMVQDPTFSQLSLPKSPLPVSPLSNIKKAKASKRKVTDVSSSTAPKATIKKDARGGVRIKQPRKNSGRSKTKSDDGQQMEGMLEGVSLSSFGPLQSCGDMKKKAKCRLMKAKAAIAKCDEEDQCLSRKMVLLQELNDKIAVTRVELAKMCEDANQLDSKIAQDSQASLYSRMHADIELQESTRLYDLASSIRDKWRKEFDHAFQSDGD